MFPHPQGTTATLPLSDQRSRHIISESISSRAGILADHTSSVHQDHYPQSTATGAIQSLSARQSIESVSSDPSRHGHFRHRSSSSTPRIQPRVHFPSQDGYDYERDGINDNDDDDDDGHGHGHGALDNLYESGVKEIPIPEPPPRSISRTERFLACIMAPGNAGEGLVGKPLL